MRYLKSWDPGNVTGLAIFDNGFLVYATHKPFNDIISWCIGYDTSVGQTVIEIPQTYRIEDQKGDQQDLIDLAYKAGRIAERHGQGNHVVLLYPREWKGQAPKHVTKRRAKAVLTSEELAIVHGEDHNMWDAIGIGLHCLKRTP